MAAVIDFHRPDFRTKASLFDEAEEVRIELAARRHEELEDAAKDRQLLATARGCVAVGNEVGAWQALMALTASNVRRRRRWEQAGEAA